MRYSVPLSVKPLPAEPLPPVGTQTPLHPSHAQPAGNSPPVAPSDWHTLRRLMPFFWQYRWRVAAALALMVAAKLANVGVPWVLKQLVDALTQTPSGQAAATLTTPQVLLVVPVSLLLAYGALRLLTSTFTELRELVFAKATEGAARAVALRVFEHLHGLSLRFHLERQTGGMTRDIERGTRAVQSLVSYSLYSIVPTLIEVVLVLTLLGSLFDRWFAFITGGALVAYVAYSVVVTEWRTQFRRRMNELDSSAHSRAVDSLLNYETVKYFNNERFEAQRYDENLERLRRAAVKSQRTLSLLNTGQQLIIATALVAMLWRAADGVASGRMTLGDFVMVNAFMIQLYIPLNFLGVIYREIKQALVDLRKLFGLLEREREVQDAPDAVALALNAAPTVTFDAVDFSYDVKTALPGSGVPGEQARQILFGVNLHIPSGQTLAVVGASGSGKSTLARLLYRFYDVQGGSVRINGQDIRALTQHSLRAAIGIVPQDTVLFNDTIGYNLRYGRVDATDAELQAAARAANIHDFIASLPLGYETTVGERGLKLSGGEKQRIALARTLLKNPSIFVFDEATSALDSHNERAIQQQLRRVSQGKTTLIIAHRLSTIADADQIAVLDAGRVVELGSHAELLAKNGRYAQMWRLQSGGGEV